MSQHTIYRTICDGCARTDDTPTAGEDIVPTGWQQVSFQHDRSRCQVRHLCPLCLEKVDAVLNQKRLA